MAVPVHLILKDDGGSQIMGSCDVHGRDGSIELRSLQHSVIIPTDNLTGKVTGSRQHCSFNFTKEIDSSSSYLFKAVATGQTLKSAEFNFYRINYSGQEEIYYTITLERVKVVREGANKQVISSQADSLIKISRIWADFFPANTSNQPI